VDVRHTGDLPGVEHPGAMALGGGSEPDDADHRDLPGRVPGGGGCLMGEASVQRRVHAGRAADRNLDI